MSSSILERAAEAREVALATAKVERARKSASRMKKRINTLTERVGHTLGVYDIKPLIETQGQMRGEPFVEVDGIRFYLTPDGTCFIVYVKETGAFPGPFHSLTRVESLEHLGELAPNVLRADEVKYPPHFDSEVF